MGGRLSNDCSIVEENIITWIEWGNIFSGWLNDSLNSILTRLGGRLSTDWLNFWPNIIVCNELGSSSTLWLKDGPVINSLISDGILSNG